MSIEIRNTGAPVCTVGTTSRLGEWRGLTLEPATTRPPAPTMSEGSA